MNRKTPPAILQRVKERGTISEVRAWKRLSGLRVACEGSRRAPRESIEDVRIGCHEHEEGHASRPEGKDEQTAG